jgi:hypothetical protein
MNAPKTAGLSVFLLAALATADRKPLPNQAGNDDVELAGTLMLERTEVQQALGADLGPGSILVRIKVAPKTDMPLRVSPDDFTLLSRKDGDRSPALEPGQIAGKGALVVKPAAQQPGGDGTRTNGPIWGGVTPRLGGGKSAAEPPTTAEPRLDDTTAEGPLLGVLKEKILADKETKNPVEGLLYFILNGKLKPKDVSLIYKGPAGKLVMDFK